MEPKKTVQPTYYNSFYEHGVDEKRRVQIPAKWRPAKSGVELTVVIWPQSKEGTCLRVLPPEQMAKLMRDIDAMPNSNPQKVPLKRFIGAGSVQVTLDTVGRICLPEPMAKAAGITDQAVLVGLLTSFEIWSPERYARIKVADGVLAPEAFQLME